MKRLKTPLAVLVTGLLLVSSAHAVTILYQPTPYLKSVIDGGATKTPPIIPHVTDGWVNNYYAPIKTFQDTDSLKIGGWGDRYLSLLKFDLVGLPQQVDDAYFYLYSLPRNGANPSQVALYRATSSWDTTVAWGNPKVGGVLEPYGPPLPSLGEGYAYSPFPGENTFYGMRITSWYNGWKNGTYQNHGIMIYPNNGVNNQFDYFVSSESASSDKRPLLALVFTPTLEMSMPLHGGYSWLATTEPGGWDCKGDWYDWAHDDAVNPNNPGGGVKYNYFSIDFAKASQDYYPATDVPILAVSDGKVSSVGYQATGNGNYIVLDHGEGSGIDPATLDGNASTGFSTLYLHLQNLPAKKNSILLKAGDVVRKGDQIGIMGTTGASTGVHLHFGVKYNGSGSKTVEKLSRVVMDRKVLRGYQTECTNGTWSKYYYSSNTPTLQ